MALIRHQSPQIVVSISDFEMGGTIIKRKARFDSLQYSQSGQSGSTGFINPQAQSPDRVVLNTTVMHFAKNADGTYGEQLDGKPGFSSYQKPLVADGTAIVDAVTGAILCNVSEYTVEAVNPGGILYGKDFMYENEFFRNMAENVAVKVDEVIIAKIQNASDRGVYNL